MPHYREDEKYWDMQKNPTTSQSTECLTCYIYICLYIQKMLCSCGPRRHAAEGETAHAPTPLLTAHANTYCRSGLIFISSCNLTFRLQGSLGQRKKLPKATQLSLISRRKGCKLNGLKASNVNYLSASESFSSSLSGQPMTNRSVRLRHPAFKLLFS